MGTQKARTVEIWNSFEVPFHLDGPCPDLDYLESKLEQYKQVFPDYEFVGWYSANVVDTPDVDLAFHQSVRAAIF